MTEDPENPTPVYSPLVRRTSGPKCDSQNLSEGPGKSRV